MKNFKNIAIVIAKIIIVLLIIIPNVLIIGTIIDIPTSKNISESIYGKTLKYPITVIKSFNSQFTAYEEENELSISDIRTLIITAKTKDLNMKDEEVELIKTYKSLSKQETYKVKLEYSKDTFLVCRVIISPSSNSESYISPTSEETLTTEEVNDILKNVKVETKTIKHYDILLENLLMYIPFLICYILLFINIIITKKSKNVANKHKEIWFYIILIAIISIFYFCFFIFKLWNESTVTTLL